MKSLRIVRHTSIAADTAVSAKVWAPPTARRIEELFAPFLEEGEAMPNLELVQKLAGRLLDFHQKLVTATDEKTEAFRVAAVLLRTHRDQAADALREELRKARYFFDQTRSKGEGARNGLGEGLSYNSPRLLARLGHEIANFLPDYAKQFKPDDSLPNPAVLEKSIRAKAEVLDQAIARLDPQAENEAVSRRYRRRDSQKAEVINRRTTAFLAGFYKLCSTTSPRGSAPPCAARRAGAKGRRRAKPRRRRLRLRRPDRVQSKESP